MPACTIKSAVFIGPPCALLERQPAALLSDFRGVQPRHSANFLKALEFTVLFAPGHNGLRVMFRYLKSLFQFLCCNRVYADLSQVLVQVLHYLGQLFLGSL